MPYTLSTVSVCTLEEVRRETKAPFWFQLYLIRDRKSKHWLSHKHWGMLFLREPQVMAYLRKADAEGIVIFDPQAADLEFTCSTLQELAEEFAKAQTTSRT